MSVWASIQSSPISGSCGGRTPPPLTPCRRRQNDRRPGREELAGFERLQYQIGALGAGGSDFLEVLGVGGACLFLFGDGDSDVAGVFNHVANGLEAGFESGNADGGRPHVNAAARLAKIKRDANHADVARGNAGERSASLSHRTSSQFPVLGSQLNLVRRSY